MAQPASMIQHSIRSIVGVLQYVNIIRRELAYSINKVSQYMHQPQEHHWKAIKQIL